MINKFCLRKGINLCFGQALRLLKERTDGGDK